MNNILWKEFIPVAIIGFVLGVEGIRLNNIGFWIILLCLVWFRRMWYTEGKRWMKAYMGSIVDISNLPNPDDKFYSANLDTTFTITNNQGILIVVDRKGDVLSPANTAVGYSHGDTMIGNQSSITGKVEDFVIKVS